MAQTQQESAPRKDPRKRRWIPGVSGTVKNKEPDREYVMGNPNDQLFGLPRLLEDGWTKVNHTRDKERVHSGRLEENGDVSFQGQVLCWISKEDFQDRLDACQDVVKAREAKANRPGGIDGITGADGTPAKMSHT